MARLLMNAPRRRTRCQWHELHLLDTIITRDRLYCTEMSTCNPCTCVHHYSKAISSFPFRLGGRLVWRGLRSFVGLLAYNERFISSGFRDRNDDNRSDKQPGTHARVQGHWISQLTCYARSSYAARSRKQRDTKWSAWRHGNAISGRRKSQQKRTGKRWQEGIVPSDYYRNITHPRHMTDASFWRRSTAKKLKATLSQCFGNVCVYCKGSWIMKASRCYLLLFACSVALLPSNSRHSRVFGVSWKQKSWLKFQGCFSLTSRTYSSAELIYCRMLNLFHINSVIVASILLCVTNSQWKLLYISCIANSRISSLSLKYHVLYSWYRRNKTNRFIV